MKVLGLGFSAWVAEEGRPVLGRVDGRVDATKDFVDEKPQSLRVKGVPQRGELV